MESVAGQHPHTRDQGEPPGRRISAVVRGLKSAVSGLPASSSKPRHHATTPNMTLGNRNISYGARPVRIHQAGAVLGCCEPQRSPPSATGGPFVSPCGARGRARRATGRKPTRKEESALKVMHWNAEGVDNKKVELEHFLDKNNINVCCIQETHLKEGKDFKIRGYQVFRSDRQERRKGGILTLVRNNISAKEVERNMEEAEYLTVKLTSRNTTCNIVNYYCPDNKKMSLDKIQVSESGFLITGDFNSRSQSWGYENMDSRGEEDETWQDENHLILINDPEDKNTFYSRRWKTTTSPDLAFCTDDLHKRSSRTVEDQLGGSDHRPVVITISGETNEKPKCEARWNYKKAKWKLFEIRTNELTKDLKIEGRNINNVVRDFNNTVLKAAKECIPRGARKEYKPFWTEELQHAHDMLSEARNEAESNPSQENHIKLQECQAKYLKTKLQSKRRSWREKTASLNMEKDTTKLWKLTQALNDEGNKGQKITLEEEEGKTHTGKRAADIFAKSYARESNTEIPKNLQKETRQEEKKKRETFESKGDIPEAMQHKITLTELQKAIKKLKKKKSPGPDGITNEMIMNLGNSALLKLLDIFNLSWTQGQVPQCWRQATMIPVLKKGKNKRKPQSYRPISLTSCTCKTMERIINQRLQLYLESESILVPEQAGFRQYKSTEDQTTHLAQVIEDAFQAKKVTLAVFIDLQKAFDKVWKDGLLVKLLRCGISGNMYRWTKSYLHNRRARVLVDGQHGKEVLLRQGVPQGGVLSPTLFILFINDLVSEIPKGVQAALYADDLVLWCTEDYASTATYRMNMALERVSTWTERWCVTINRDKTTGTLFTLSPKETVKKLAMGTTTIKMEDQQTYLGVTYDKRLTWNHHITQAEMKARRKLNIMRKLAGTEWGSNEQVLKSVYQGAVRPHLEYGSNSWMTAAKTHLETLDKVQNNALRIITGGMKSTPIQQMEKLTGIAPLCQRRKQKAMTQDMKYKCNKDQPMGKRLENLSSGRLNRSSFAHETWKLNQEHQGKLPTIQPINFTLDNPPWQDKDGKVRVNMTVPGITKKDEQNDIVKKTLTQAMLEESYPKETWVHAYTDGSAKDATSCGGAGVFIQHPDGEEQNRAEATGKHCTNYKAEVDALIHAAELVKDRVDQDTQVVFLTDALSVLQAYCGGQLPELENTLNNLKCLQKVLQWVPSHCGLKGNEEADKLAKKGSQNEQPDKPVSLKECRTIIKSLFRPKQTSDSYHSLPRKEQVIIMRLRTGHNRLNRHMHKVMKKAPSPLCSCGEADQDAAHILQDCVLHQQQRKTIWPEETTLREKLHGPVEQVTGCM